MRNLSPMLQGGGQERKSQGQGRSLSCDASWPPRGHGKIRRHGQQHWTHMQLAATDEVELSGKMLK
eukprot:2643937-Pyramimonas_sp.AAC.1